jgi:hypothetical protein
MGLMAIYQKPRSSVPQALRRQQDHILHDKLPDVGEGWHIADTDLKMAQAEYATTAHSACDDALLTGMSPGESETICMD